MSKSNILCVALLALVAGGALAQSADTVLLSNSVAKVTKADYDAQLAKMPPDIRDGFGNDARRVNELLSNMLVSKSLAAKARADKLDARPDVAARLALETDLLLGKIEAEAIQAVAGAEFDANIARYESRAREMYLVNKARFTDPPQVSATHILFDTKKRSADEAKKLAVETRAKIVAGADMSQLAKQLSDDPGSGQKGGALGFFAEKEMDPAFGAAAFSLAKPGDLSQPVQSKFGWHIIRLDEKRPAKTKPYEEAREAIITELRTNYIAQKFDDTVAAIRRDPKTDVNREAVGELTPKLDPETIRRAQEAASAPAPK